MRFLDSLQAVGIAAALANVATQAGSTIVTRSTTSPTNTFDDVKSCRNLPDVLQQLLAAGMVADGTPLETSDLYSVHYPAGSNPTAEDFYATIPSSVFTPTDDRSGSLTSAMGWDRDAVIADSGYGEQARSADSKQGGLPPFCRVGGMVQTSSAGSKAHFEVWLPLAVVPDPEDVRPVGRPNGDDGTTQGGSIQKRAALAAKASFKRACSSGWNRRLVFVVGGGLRGSVAYPEMKQTMSRYHVAVAGSNLGHFSAQNGTKWIPANPEAWTDYGHRAVHLSTQIAQLAVSTFYDAKPASKAGKASSQVQRKDSDSELIFYSYFKGCSTGGRSAMAAVQRYPLDFDGVIAGCPGFDFNYLKAYQLHVNSFLADNQSASFIPPTAYPLIHKAVLTSCDAQDGVKDEVVSLPHQCKPDFAKLIGCTSLGINPVEDAVADAPKTSVTDADGSTKKPKVPLLPRDVKPVSPSDPRQPVTDPKQPDTRVDGTKDAKDKDDKKKEAPKCLTDAQLETVKNIFTDYTINGKLIREAVLPGSELGWTVTNAITGKSMASPSSWFHYQVLGATVWDDKSFDPLKELTPELIQQGEEKDPGGTITFNPDLSKFFDKGGKLLHYHGLSDPLVPPGASPRYYDLVKKTVGRNIADSYKLYLIDGMLHCRGGAGTFNFGGAGQADEPGLRPLRYDSKHDMFLALVDWVEKGQAPTSLIGVAYKTDLGGAPTDTKGNTNFANGVRNTRLLCPYPTEARLRRDRRGDTNDASAFECA